MIALIFINVELTKLHKKSLSMIKNDVKDFDELLDVKYGKRGTPERENWENELESFKLGVLIESLFSKKIKIICNVL